MTKKKRLQKTSMKDTKIIVIKFLESLFPITHIEMSVIGIYFETEEHITEAEKMINDYLEYDKNI